jgi:hypothetical protein
MKRATTRRSSNSEPGKKKVLRLSRETVRRLGSGDLSQAVGGSCDTTSNATDSVTLTRTKVTVQQG